ncbi:GSU2403 family nucleotidyltransferase fold protein [Rhodoferax fermentans]|uniref:Nucleotidyltransferase-like domain-containing protein n=1 Tax=Rhodoferax fermentans TaxID=28066 RepID=A0A1T1ANL0_RHOFE|nr:GSU2403 family nucleotidyltransferase fold protein [Rhodoferax fermentans]MBK1683124.1 hypothetical protein [Rhodoferax fermentans]OOV05720.1 hypothetical protein RF819_02490 [Rhodoferax fermentans]
MRFLPISDNTARQAIDSANIWSEYLNALDAAKPYSGGMYWKKEGAYEYLVKTLAGNKQQRLGARSLESEHIYAAFHARKKTTTERLSCLAAALDEAQRLNKAVRAGRTPEIVVKLLNALREAGLEKHFRVVGTHALYAYECAAGVRIVASTVATQDVNLLWDASRRVEFLVDPQRDAGSVLALLQRVDPSFQRRDDELNNKSAINAKGFEVEFLRVESEAGDTHPFQFSNTEGDLRHVQARSEAVLAQSALFSQPVISATGKMATMRTIDPQTFVEFKRWTSGLESREVTQRRRDALQADAVQELLVAKMLASNIS